VAVLARRSWIWYPDRMNTLHDDTVRTALEDLEGWEFAGDRIRRELSFPGFRDAIAFIVRVADLADAADHHPELHNVYASVTIELTSHDAGGVTERDIALARAIDAVVDPEDDA
jgi:4a-hydroxytetrahydrobiopterin dehydratase